MRKFRQRTNRASHVGEWPPRRLLLARGFGCDLPAESARRRICKKSVTITTDPNCIEGSNPTRFQHCKRFGVIEWNLESAAEIVTGTERNNAQSLSSLTLQSCVDDCMDGSVAARDGEHFTVTLHLVGNNGIPILVMLEFANGAMWCLSHGLIKVIVGSRRPRLRIHQNANLHWGPSLKAVIVKIISYAW